LIFFGERHKSREDKWIVCLVERVVCELCFGSFDFGFVFDDVDDDDDGKETRLLVRG
jgi:hypothetical protein